MTCPAGLSQWAETVSIHMSHLSKPQAAVLALWSFGIVMTKSCGQSTVAEFLANLLGERANTLRQRLREWYYDAADKRGAKRRHLHVAESFCPLVRWVLSRWPSHDKRLALAMDATCLAQVFTVLAVSVLYRGCAIPVAWVIVPGNAKGAWKPHWLDLFRHLRTSVPQDWTVLVMADRGLYAPWLFEQIVQLGWHPYLRIHAGGKCRTLANDQWRPLRTRVARSGRTWCEPVICFKAHPLRCTLLTCWPEGYADPWLIVTDLPREQANIVWYSLRTWIECGFKDLKRGGWQWQQTRITDPERASRFWLSIAVATLWVVSVGGEEEVSAPNSTREAAPAARLLSCFHKGTLAILASIVAGAPRLVGRFYPEPWPSTFIRDRAGPSAIARHSPAFQETYP